MVDPDIVAGGLASPRPGDVSEADRLAAKLAQWGVPPDRIAVERSSRNTRENAIESAKLASARGWRSLLLVTSAYHAPRARTPSSPESARSRGWCPF